MAAWWYFVPRHGDAMPPKTMASATEGWRRYGVVMASGSVTLLMADVVNRKERIRYLEESSPEQNTFSARCSSAPHPPPAPLPPPPGRSGQDFPPPPGRSGQDLLPPPGCCSAALPPPPDRCTSSSAGPPQCCTSLSAPVRRAPRDIMEHLNIATQGKSAEASDAASNYDPKTDPKRKPGRSNDPGWKYAFWPTIGNRDLLQCCLCDRTVTGGITRLKEHLVGGYGDILKCAKTRPAIAQEMQAALKGKKRPLLLNDDGELQGEDDDVLDATEESQDASRSIMHPSSGTAAKRKQSSFLKFRAPKEPDTKSVGSMLRRTPKEVVEERHSKGPSQISIQASMRTKEEREAVNLEWARFFYECGIPFNAANSRQFEIAIEATAQYGSGYKPPTYHELREPLLEKVVKEIYDLRKRHEDAWKQYGCTLMSDGWTDRRGHHLINFLVNSPEGTFFLESIDASSEVHDQVMLADLLEKRISDIGVDKVVQVVTDNGANYKVAGKLLMERFPTLFWTPCAAHCLDLMLEDVGKLKAFKKPISRARHVTTFIYRHGRLLSAMREKIGGRDLVRPAATRFVTTFLTLQSLHKHRDALRYLFTSNDWTSCKLAKTEAGKKVYDIVLSREFWNSVEDCLRASLPLIIVLRVVDGDERPAMPEVASLMNHAKERINAAFCTENKRSLLNNILQIIEGHWDRQMDTPLYGAALFLNPGKFYAIQKENDEYVGHLRGCFNDVLARMVEDETL
ncbi:uncharacterized protein LOC133927517 [Phragmites australis]|uniref:uncharacterized protein LOC133927517 n=1 Tax=Phragmites australis TaxID=29695 RepID=UPI002D79F058|nr:uncharacterized protein LOC133927517 [Phragmites australis]